MFDVLGMCKARMEKLGYNLSASSGFQELSPYKQNQFTYEFTILPDILCYQDTLTTNLYGAHAQDIKT